MEPPAVTFDDDGAAVVFDGATQWAIRWAQVVSISVTVVTVDDAYSEAFWAITGSTGDAEPFMVPVNLIAGGDEFTAHVMAFPDFDREAYQQARNAEANYEPGTFECWRSPKLHSK